jgi:hypothetical protein
VLKFKNKFGSLRVNLHGPPRALGGLLREYLYLYLYCDRKGLPGSVPKMEKTVGPVSKCGRELLRSLWRLIGIMVSFIIFIESVRNILNLP